MKLIRNTTVSPVKIQLEGKTYAVEAEGTLLVEDVVAEQWKRIHGFLIVEEPEMEPEKKVKEPAPEVSVMPEEVVEKPKEEKPVRSRGGKNKAK